MLLRDDLEHLRRTLPADPDRAALLATLRRRSEPLLLRAPVVPEVKAALSRAGGRCPDDGATFRFDPWSAEVHRCPRCGRAVSGAEHHAYWARAQHLWLAERAAESALLGSLLDDDRYAELAARLLAEYGERYFELPNRDNVLGPSHLFFSTYLESLWLTSWLAAAFMLRESGRLPGEVEEAVSRVADEAATIIAEFNEGLSNRQTWHAAALTAIAAWFGDEELARSAVEARTGIVGHLTDGFGEDGLWWEGENYHLFALRGVLWGIHWSHAAGYDLLDAPELREHLGASLLAPSRTALPDFTYPARRDSRYGVSLALPASLELWEVGRAWLPEDDRLDGWLGALYRMPAPPPGETYDAWLHDAGLSGAAGAGRAGLSWWALTALRPMPPVVPEWRPESTLLADQGLAILREALAYASLECGPVVGGHGHPDRLHLTLHADGVHWLPDLGTGSYVVPELHWYRSALAHNAPLLDGVNAGGAGASCRAFDAADGWRWCRGTAGPLTRTVAAGPGQLLDVLDLQSETGHLLELPWHLLGALEVASPGSWEPAAIDAPFLHDTARFVAQGSGAYHIRATAPSGQRLDLLLHAPGAELLRATAPGLPTEGTERPFLLLRGPGSSLRWTAWMAWGESQLTGATITVDGDVVKVESPLGPAKFRFGPAGLAIEHGAEVATLGGLLPERRTRPHPAPERHDAVAGRAPAIPEPPALDGSLDGFDASEPLLLDGEHQYRRSEEAYDPERFAVQAFVNWDGGALYAAVHVAKPDLVFRAPDAESQALDNEAEDINSDGIQLYLRRGNDVLAELIVPREDGSLSSRRLDPATHPAPVAGGWSPTEDGYLVTLRLPLDSLGELFSGDRIGFDLLVNEMRPERLRRAGQLVWGGDGGWVYLRGDRHDLDRLGVLELG